MILAVGAEPWDTEWAAQKAAEALRYLQRVASILTYPQVDVTPASQGSLSSRSHARIMQCGSRSLKPAVGRYPECLENLRALDKYEEEAHQAAMRGDRDGYLEALRSFCRAGRDAALEIRKGAA